MGGGQKYFDANFRKDKKDLLNSFKNKGAQNITPNLTIYKHILAKHTYHIFILKMAQID